MFKICKSFWLSVILMAATVTCTMAQESVTAGGSTAASATGNVSWTVGQPFYTSASSASGSVNAGVQQGFEFRPVSGWLDVTLTADVFPNPTSGLFTMTINEDFTGTLTATLVTLAGETVIIRQVHEATTQFDAGALAAGTYLLHITDDDGIVVRTFKIIKK